MFFTLVSELCLGASSQVLLGCLSVQICDWGRLDRQAGLRNRGWLQVTQGALQTQDGSELELPSRSPVLYPPALPEREGAEAEKGIMRLQLLSISRSLLLSGATALEKTGAVYVTGASQFQGTIFQGWQVFPTWLEGARLEKGGFYQW